MRKGMGFGAAVLAAMALAGPAAADGPGAVGIGGTLPVPLYAAWAAAYARETGVEVVYQADGTSAGLAALAGGRVAFAASDSPLSGDALPRGDVELATAVTGVVPVMNVRGIDPGGLVLDGKVVAAMFAGKIVLWDDPRVRSLNPHARLPHDEVRVVHRSDASGTTATFLSWLTKAGGGGWAAGEGTRASWPVGLGVKGNDGVADAVASTPGAIGYVGYDTALARGLAYPLLVNADGKVVQPTVASFRSASEGADWMAPGMVADLVSRPGPASWPVTTATYVVMRAGAADAGAAKAAAGFLGLGISEGGSAAEDIGFVPLPPEAAERARATLAGASR